MRGAALVVIAACWVMGVVLFPRALEPGRAERDGIELNLLVDTSEHGEPNDWYKADSRTRVQRSGEVLVVSSRGATSQLVSRPLAVFARRCYEVTALAAAAPAARLVVLDHGTTRHLARTEVPAGAEPSPFRLVFRAPDDHRVAFALVALPGTTVRIGRVALRPTGDECPPAGPA